MSGIDSDFMGIDRNPFSLKHSFMCKTQILKFTVSKALIIVSFKNTDREVRQEKMSKYFFTSDEFKI